MNKSGLSFLFLGAFLSTIAINSQAQSAGQQVTEAFDQIQTGTSVYTFDLISITDGVINTTKTCEDTFDAVRTAVSLQPEQAAKIISSLSVKKNCNCTDGGLWAEQQMYDWLSSAGSFVPIAAETSYSCTQVMVSAGIFGLPQNDDYAKAGTAD